MLHRVGFFLANLVTKESIIIKLKKSSLSLAAPVVYMCGSITNSMNCWEITTTTEKFYCQLLIWVEFCVSADHWHLLLFCKPKAARKSRMILSCELYRLILSESVWKKSWFVSLSSYAFNTYFFNQIIILIFNKGQFFLIEFSNYFFTCKYNSSSEYNY